MDSFAPNMAWMIHAALRPSFLLPLSFWTTAMPRAEVSITIAAGYISPSTSSAPRNKCSSRYATRPACTNGQPYLSLSFRQQVHSSCVVRFEVRPDECASSVLRRMGDLLDCSSHKSAMQRLHNKDGILALAERLNTELSDDNALHAVVEIATNNESPKNKRLISSSADDK